ncbi:MAG: hypothetical protein ACLU8W_08860 [Clostridia bacterium]
MKIEDIGFVERRVCSTFANHFFLLFFLTGGALPHLSAFALPPLRGFWPHHTERQSHHSADNSHTGESGCARQCMVSQHGCRWRAHLWQL